MNGRRRRLLLLSLCVVVLSEHLRRKKKRRVRNDSLHVGSLLTCSTGDVTPWLKLFSSKDNSSFIRTLGFGVSEFNYLLRLFSPLYESFTIHQPHRNKYRKVTQARKSRKFDAASCLALVLNFFRTTSYQYSLCLVFGIDEGSLSRYLRFGISILLNVLHKLPEAQVRWPNAEQIGIYASAIHERYNDLTKCWGFLDGLNIRIHSKQDPVEQNKYYSS